MQSNKNDRPRFGELLDRAHQQGLIGIETECLKMATAEDASIVFKAVVTLKGDNGPEPFTAHGDADPQNTGKMILPHLLRMAETRAIARALRWATNEGRATLEEMGEDEASGDTAPDNRTADWQGARIVNPPDDWRRQLIGRIQKGEDLLVDHFGMHDAERTNSRQKHLKTTDLAAADDDALAEFLSHLQNKYAAADRLGDEGEVETLMQTAN